MNLANRVQNVDRRIIYTLVFIFLALPLFVPLGLPLRITRETRAAYDFIRGLPAGTKVLFVDSTGPATAPELEPQSVAMLRHMQRLGHRIVMAPLAADTLAFVLRYGQMLTDLGYQEGEDFIILPFMAGGETVYASMASDIRSLYADQPSSPLWDAVENISSFGLVIDVSGGESQRWAIAHIEGPYGIPVVAAITAVILAVTQPFFAAGQFMGLVSGLNGAAEYEVLARVPGKAAAGMDAQSLGHALIIFFVFLGNLGYWASRSGKPTAAKGGAR